MRIGLLVISLCLLAGNGLAADGGSVVVSPIGDDSLVTEPRTVISGAFLLENRAGSTINLKSDIRSPRGWELIAKDIPTSLGPNEKEIGLVSLRVPRMAPAGQYRLTYVVEAIDTSSIRDSTTIEILIPAAARLEIEILSAPECIVAGDDYVASFAVINRGNIQAEVDLEADTNAGLPYAISAEHLLVPPGESRMVTVLVKTAPNLRRRLGDRLVLIAAAAGPSEAKARAVQPMEVIPRVTDSEDRFHRIPVQLAVRHMLEDDSVWLSRFQMELAGEGTFDEAGDRHLAFLIRAPDMRRGSITGRHDEYALSHWTETYQIAAGDHGYSISPLLEQYRYGRGVKGKLNLRNASIGAYHLDTRNEEPFQRQTAGYLDYPLRETGTIRLTYLAKSVKSLMRAETGYATDLAGCEIKLEPTEYSELELEYGRVLAASGDNDAYRLDLRVTTDRLSFFQRHKHADPGFLGYLTDTDQTSSSLGIDLGHGFKLDGSFSGEKRNLRRDPSKLSAPTDRSYSVRLDYRDDLVGDIAVALRRRSYKNLLLDPQVNLGETSARLAVGRRFQLWSVHASIERGKSKDKLRWTVSRLHRYAFSLFIQPSPRHSYRCYVNYDNSFLPEKSDRRNMTAGCNASFRIRAGTRLNLGFRLDNPRNPVDQNRDVVEMGFSHRLSNRHALQAHCQYTANADGDVPDQLAFTVEYRLGFGVPASRKERIGSLKGRVHDEETGKPVKDAILRLDGITAVTDAKGNFVFPSTSAGTHHLDIDRGSIGLDRVTRQKIPAEIYTEGGKTAYVELTTVKGAAVGGEVILFSYEGNRMVLPPEGFERNLLRERGIPSILVELSDGHEARRVITGVNGDFRFNEVRPGIWTLKVYEENLPEHTYIEGSTVEINLAPGEQRHLLLRVLPRRRPVQVIEEGGTIKEKVRP